MIFKGNSKKTMYRNLALCVVLNVSDDYSSLLINSAKPAASLLLE
jgi:hypothetical protein